MDMLSCRRLGIARLGTAGLAFAVVLAGAQTPQAPGKGNVPIMAPPGGKPTSSSITPKVAPIPSKVIPGADVVHFQSTIGAFKLLGSDTVPVMGKMDMKFTGAVLVSGLDKKGTVETKGDVHLEKEALNGAKKVYFGNGEIVVTGTLRSLQFFGKDVSGTYKGVGIFRLFGEFDKKLQTGFIWYEGGEHRPWGSSGLQVVVPNPQATESSATFTSHPATKQ